MNGFNKFHLSLVIVFISLNLSQAFGNYNYFESEKNKSKLSKESFERYIKPQIKGLMSDFFQILRIANPIENEIINLRNQILDLNLAWQTWRKNCQKISEECEEPLAEVYATLRKLDLTLGEVFLNKVKLKGFKVQSDIDATLMLIRDLDQISIASYTVSHQMEELLLTVNTGFYYNKSHPDLSPILHNMLISSEFILTSQVDATFRKEIEFIWENFLKEMETKLIIESDQEFLLARLGDFNIAWNGFHMRMAKERYVSRSQKKYTLELFQNIS